jgi:biopolymer transport protein ExbD
MARRQRRAGPAEQNIDLTPMLDVTFILLIFFIVTAQFIKDTGVDINRQDVKTDDWVSPLAILVAIDKKSDIYINKQIVKPTEVAYTIRELRQDNPKGEIVVQVDKDSKAGILEQVMTAIQEADADSSVNIATAQE